MINLTEKLKLAATNTAYNNTYDSDYICNNIADLQKLDSHLDNDVLEFVEKKVTKWPIYIWKIKNGENRLQDFTDDIVNTRRKKFFNTDYIPNNASDVKISSANTVCICYRTVTNSNFIELYLLYNDYTCVIFNED